MNFSNFLLHFFSIGIVFFAPGENRAAFVVEYPNNPIDGFDYDRIHECPYKDLYRDRINENRKLVEENAQLERDLMNNAHTCPYKEIYNDAAEEHKILLADNTRLKNDLLVCYKSSHRHKWSFRILSFLNVLKGVADCIPPRTEAPDKEYHEQYDVKVYVNTKKPKTTPPTRPMKTYEYHYRHRRRW